MQGGKLDDITVVTALLKEEDVLLPQGEEDVLLPQEADPQELKDAA